MGYIAYKPRGFYGQASAGSAVWVDPNVGEILLESLFGAPEFVDISGGVGVGVSAVGTLQTVRLLQGAANVGVSAVGALVAVPVIVPPTVGIARVTVRAANSAAASVARVSEAITPVQPRPSIMISASVGRVNECRLVSVRPVNRATATQGVIA